jgi:hypothetical protein
VRCVASEQSHHDGVVGRHLPLIVPLLRLSAQLRNMSSPRPLHVVLHLSTAEPMPVPAEKETSSLEAEVECTVLTNTDQRPIKFIPEYMQASRLHIN